MYRGTTPTLNFTLPMQADTLTKCSIVLAQNNVIVIEKKLSDCTITGKQISCTLTEAETLSLDNHKEVEIQMRVYVGAVKLASQIWKMPVGRILKDGVLS